MTPFNDVENSDFWTHSVDQLIIIDKLVPSVPINVIPFRLLCNQMHPKVSLNPMVSWNPIVPLGAIKPFC